MSKTAMIDAHAMLGEEGHQNLDAAELLRRMDGAGVDLAIARPVGSGLIVDHRAGNDLVLNGGSRIRGLVSVNPWWGDKALEEMRRCRDLGAVGLFLDPLRQGFFPTESIASRVYDLAAEYRWPIMVRTGAYIYADVLAVVQIARRYPSIEFIAGFGGCADMWFEVDGAIGAVPNLHLDTSMLWAEGIASVITKHGPNRVLFGSAEPRNRYQVNLSSLDRLELSTPVREAVLHANAARIFQIE
jgi:predicted TIM-barrel fold metal-dependent hydrolase